LPTSPRVVLQPRKSPVQARSAASVDAILDATLQVLRSVGKERLTTTKVAARAGFSIGTLYQYFPNKSSLLQAALRRHLEKVAQAVERACMEYRSQPVVTMASGLALAFLKAKMEDAKTSVALYSVSADLDGAKIQKEMSARSNGAIVAMLATAPEALDSDPQRIAATLQGAMAGVIRRVLEAERPEQELQGLREELLTLVQSYVKARCVKQLQV
jgi:AcrR family transcriptional regulator